MQSTLLLPHRYQLVGWLIFIPALVLGLTIYASDYSASWLTVDVPNAWLPEEYRLANAAVHRLNLTNTVGILVLLVGLGLIAFSREAIEDEMIARLRLESLQWSLLVNYVLLAIATLLVYGFSYNDVLIFNMFTPLLVFILRFRWLLRRHSNLLAL
ncbi:hypothetical protein ACAW74_24925 [Fibrella sp. WM1]|uniref:hypothetical protein n=1 Tax=Fibrella musci TaxID=3242485 RepID=UPI0035229411